MDATNRNTALASAMVEELARCGVRRAVIAPGSRSTPLALALWRQPAIATAVLLDERCAAFFALGAAHAEGRPAVVLTTSGTAAANLHPAVCEANEAGVPLIALTADRPPELRDIGAGQTIDQLKLFGSSVRWFCEVGVQEADDAGLLHVRSVACRAYAAARGEPRPGPVHLNVPWREPLGPEPRPDEVTATSELALEGRGERPLTAVAPSPALVEPILLNELGERIAAERRGLIVCGRQPDPALGAHVAGLARASGYPILPEPTSQVRLGDHDRELVVWPYDAIARHRPAALEPAVVLRFGDLPTSKPLRQWLGDLRGIRQVVFDPSYGWNEPTRHAETLVRADPASAAAGVAQRLDRGPGEWTAAWRSAGEAAGQALEAGLAELQEPTEPGLQAALGRLYADGDLVYTASSMPIRDQEAFLPSNFARVRFLCNRGANGIDGLVSSGIGAAAASGRPTWIVTGDLGLVHDSNGLGALGEANAPVRIVVPNNDGGAIFEFLPQVELIDREEFEALFATPSGVDLSRLANAYGVPHRRVTRLDELAEATKGTGIVEVPVERSRNVSVHRELSERVGAALSAALGA